jgi:ABC-type Na+ efflux pump permease subunit
MVRTHGARIVVGQPYADVLGQQGAPTHRKMLMVERVAASTLTAAASVYMLPLFMYDDLCSLEQMLTSSPPSPQQLYFANIIEVVCDIPYVAGRV